MGWLHAVIDVPVDQVAAAADFWEASYLHLQVIEGLPRVHPDLEADDPDGTVDRALALDSVGRHRTLAVASRRRTKSRPVGVIET